MFSLILIMMPVLVFYNSRFYVQNVVHLSRFSLSHLVVLMMTGKKILPPSEKARLKSSHDRAI